VQPDGSPWSTGHQASTASVFGSDSLDFSHAPGLDTGAGLGFPGRLRVLPAPEIPGTMSKPKGRPRKYQDGPSSCLGTASSGGRGISWTPVWQEVGIIGAWFAAGIRIYAQFPGGTAFFRFPSRKCN